MGRGVGVKPALARAEGGAPAAGEASEEVRQRARRRTLRLAVFLSAWAPLATGIAVVMSRSTTQVADFVRRTIELVAVVVAYAAFVRASRASSADRAARWERTANRTVAVALLGSAVAIVVVALVRGGGFRPGGNVVLGIVIALLGLITNAWFWRRYVGFERDRPSTIIGGQRVFYRAKCAVDAVVLAALSAVMLAPTWAGTRTVDLVGSLAVSAYLVWSGVRALAGGAAVGETSEGR